LYGRGVQPDRSLAARLFKLAASQNHSNAIGNLGFCLLNGYGVPEDHDAAFNLFEKAAIMGDSCAQLHLGTQWLAREQLETGIEWLRKAAASGDEIALFGCARALLAANSCDEMEARELFRKAAEAGIANGKYGYGLCLLMGIGGPSRKSKGADLVKIAADEGLATAQYDYAMCLNYGVGVRLDLAKAGQYAQMAANQGISNEVHTIGISVLYGRVEPDGTEKAEVRMHWRMAAQKGYVEAKYHLGLVLIERNQVLVGCRCLKAAANGGHKLAKEVLTTKCSGEGF
jgi:TPR repeat protein